MASTSPSRAQGDTSHRVAIANDTQGEAAPEKALRPDAAGRGRLRAIQGPGEQALRSEPAPVAGGRGRRSTARLFVVCADLFGLSLAWGFAAVPALMGAGGASAPTALACLAAGVAAFVAVAVGQRLYAVDHERPDHAAADELGAIAMAALAAGVAVFAAAEALVPLEAPGFGSMLVFVAVLLLAVTGGRVAARHLLRQRPEYAQNVLIVGAGEVGQLLARKLEDHPEYGLNIVGFVDPEPVERRADLGKASLLGTLDELPAIVEQFGIERV